MKTKNARFNRFAPTVCGVPLIDKDSAPHTNRFPTSVPTVNTSNLAKSVETWWTIYRKKF